MSTNKRKQESTINGTGSNGKTSRKKKQNTNGHNNQRKVAEPHSDCVLLHDTIEEKGALVGYNFQRALKVKLPDGSSKLLPLKEFIKINFVGAWDILPNVLRVLDSENRKCEEFVSSNKYVSQHSVESKLKKYLAARPEEISVSLSQQLEATKIITKEMKSGKTDSESK